MSSYKDFNAFNCAPSGVKSIVVQGDNGKVGRIPLPEAMQAPTEQKRYSFAALSDVHTAGDDTQDANVDFIRAMRFINESDIEFTCICGDLLDGGTEWLYGQYAGSDAQAGLKPTYAEKPIYEITGNHEAHSGNTEVSDESWALFREYIGREPYYSFTHGDDVFIMLSEYGWSVDPLFAEGELQFLYETLEANRNKRCFVFFHVFSGDEGDSGLPTSNFYVGGNLFDYSDINRQQGNVFLSLLRHYKNTVWFHGHSHTKFELQAIDKHTVYSESCGYRSVHIPSLARPKDIENGVGKTDEGGSQGYVVDVYDDCIVLRGRDFANEHFLPQAIYKIDTVLTEIEANAFSDSTGMITIEGGENNDDY